MAANTLGRDYDINRTLEDYLRRISFLERRLRALFGSKTPGDVATQACRLTRGSDYSIPHATTETIPFTSEVFDNNGMHDNSVNPTRITFNQAGYYVFGANVEMQNGSDYTRVNLQIRKSGGSHIAFTQTGAIAGNLAQRYAIAGMDHFVEGDYLELRVFQQNGAGNARNLVVSSDYSPIFYAGKIGS